MNEVTSGVTRRAISTQMREHCEANGLSFEQVCDGGPVRYLIDGEELSPGDAADKYLPGGFAGSFGRR